MSLETVVRKLLTYWYIIIIGTLLTGAAFLPWSRRVTYQASIGYGISFDNLSQDSPTLSSPDQSTVYSTYAFMLQEISKYLVSRFESVETQTFIDSQMQTSHGRYTAAKPFYEVLNQSAGFVSLSYEAQSREEAEKFLEVSNIAYNNIVDEWNQNRPGLFQTTPTQSLTYAIAEVTMQSQLQLVPVFIGLFLSTAIVLILPIRGTKNFKTTSSKK